MDAALGAAHVLHLVDRDVDEPAPEEPGSHGEKGRTPALRIRLYRLDGSDARPRTVHTEALATSERFVHGSGLLDRFHDSMVQPIRAAVG